MRKIATASIAAVLLGLAGTTLAAPGLAAPGSMAPPGAAPQASPEAGQIMVKFRDDAAAQGVLRQHGLSQGGAIGSTGAHLIKVPAGSESRIIEALSRNSAVEYAEPDQLVTATTNDTYFGDQYALQNDGQSITSATGTVIAGGTADADVDAVEAWSVTTGGGTKVAVLDTGVANSHVDIAPQVVGWTDLNNPGSTQNPEDLYGHGTHVAGIVAAIAGNSTGVAGVCPACTILDVKVLDDAGSGSTSNVAKGIDWAATHGAKVINMSLGQRVSSRTLEIAVNNAWKAGAVIVAAAGNAGTQAKIYPGAYPNVIAVAATDNNDEKASFSSYGKWVDVAAPGVNVFSTFPNHSFVLGTQYGRSTGYDVASGTSMASPVVAAIAALAWSSHSGATNTSVRANVELTADTKGIAGTGAYWAYGRVNADKAVR